MAVSSSANFLVTGRQLMERSLRMIGVLRSGESASESLMSDTRLVLNSILKEADSKDLGLWMLTSSTLTTIAGQSTYSNFVPDDIFELYKAVYIRATNDELPLDIIGWSRYESIGDKTITGDPEQILISDDRAQASKTIILYPTPNAAKTVRLRYKRSLFDIDTDADDLDVPMQFFGYLAYELAYQIAEEYPVEVTKAQRLFQVARDKEALLKKSFIKKTDNLPGRIRAMPTIDPNAKLQDYNGKVLEFKKSPQSDLVPLLLKDVLIAGLLMPQRNMPWEEAMKRDVIARRLYSALEPIDFMSEEIALMKKSLEVSGFSPVAIAECVRELEGMVING